MTRHIFRTFTPEERKDFRRSLATTQAQKEEIIALGRAHFERHEALREVVRVLQEERRAQGLTLADLEARTGISECNLSRLEDEHTHAPELETLMAIADALGGDLDIGFIKRDAA